MIVWLRSIALNSGVLITANALPFNVKFVAVWSSYMNAAFVVLRTVQSPRWKARMLVSVAPVLKVLPPLSVLTRLPGVAVPFVLRNPAGVTFV